MKAENRLITQLNGICESVATLAGATNHAKELSAKADFNLKGLSDEERRHTAKRLEIVVESLGPIAEDLSELQKSIQPSAVSSQPSGHGTPAVPGQPAKEKKRRRLKAVRSTPTGIADR